MLSFSTSTQTPRMQDCMLANVHQQVHKECIKADGFPPKKRNNKVTLGRIATGHN